MPELPCRAVDRHLTSSSIREARPSARPIVALASVALVGSVLWVVLMVAAGGPPEDYDDALRKIRLDVLGYATYLNVAFLVTLPVTLLMAALYGRFGARVPRWAGLSAVVVVPVYCTLNLVVYLSQITVVPMLVEMSRQPGMGTTSDVLLTLTLQALPGSAFSFFNLLAYAILGIPSLVFGVALARESGRWLRAAGRLLSLSAIGSVAGFAGAITRFDLLRAGAVAGGVLFLFALVALVVGLSRTAAPQSPAP